MSSIEVGCESSSRSRLNDNSLVLRPKITIGKLCTRSIDLSEQLDHFEIINVEELDDLILKNKSVNHEEYN